jgi:hypothetical protein
MDVDRLEAPQLIMLASSKSSSKNYKTAIIRLHAISVGTQHSCDAMKVILAVHCYEMPIAFVPPHQASTLIKTCMHGYQVYWPTCAPVAIYVTPRTTV